MLDAGAASLESLKQDFNRVIEVAASATSRRTKTRGLSPYMSVVLLSLFDWKRPLGFGLSGGCARGDFIRSGTVTLGTLHLQLTSSSGPIFTLARIHYLIMMRHASKLANPVADCVASWIKSATGAQTSSTISIA